MNETVDQKNVEIIRVDEKNNIVVTETTSETSSGWSYGWVWIIVIVFGIGIGLGVWWYIKKNESKGVLNKIVDMSKIEDHKGGMSPELENACEHLIHKTEDPIAMSQWKDFKIKDRNNARLLCSTAAQTQIGKAKTLPIPKDTSNFIQSNIQFGKNKTKKLPKKLPKKLSKPRTKRF